MFFTGDQKHRGVKKLAQGNSRNLPKETAQGNLGIQVFLPNILFPAHCFPNRVLSELLRLSQKSLPEAISKGVSSLPLQPSPPPYTQAPQGQEKSASVLKINLSPPSITKNNPSLVCRGEVVSNQGLD